MLDVERGVNTDARVEQLEHVLVALRMARSRRIRVRELIDHGQPRMPGEDRIEIHLLELCSAILDLGAWHDRHSFQQRFGFLPAVCFHNADHHLASFALFLPRSLKHGVGLAHARRHPKENLQFTAGRLRLVPLHARENLVRIRACRLTHR